MKETKRIYVAPTGANTGLGTKDSPFTTVEAASNEARLAVASGNWASVEVIFLKGEYRIDPIKLTQADSGNADCPVCYKAQDGEEVILSGGITLKRSMFSPVCGEAADRLSPEAKENVLELDLGALGITKEEVGPLYAIGGSNTASHYDGDTVGKNCELFWNNKRMTIARYPNEGFLKIFEVANVGDFREFPQNNYANTYRNNRNPQGFSLILDKETNDRAKTWAQPELGWIFGYFYWDWADGSSPIRSIETDFRRMHLGYFSSYGVRKGTNYYFYNILEELDVPNEYYIDRDNMKIYLYPQDDCQDPKIMLSLCRDVLFTASGVEYLTVEGLTFEGTRNDALSISGNYCTVKDCVVRNVASAAMHVSGYNNTVCGCDISRTGAGGISLNGGDRKTLTPGNNVAINNYVHDWAEINLTYSSGISTSGVGNLIAHNELTNSPHMAIGYSGNDHVIEYNYLHEVVLQSHDAGAIYSGRDLSAYGNVMRYNILENIGNEEYSPCGIYWDDTQAGQTAYGNLLINNMGNGFLVGGGRDNTVINNIIVNSMYPIHFDARGRDGIIKNGWYTGALQRTGGLWSALDPFDTKNGIWAEKYPSLAKMHNNYDDLDSPDFGMNPGYALVKNNICIATTEKGNLINEAVYQFGTVENNVVTNTIEGVFVDDKYTPSAEILAQLDNFELIPIEKIGRNK